MLSFCVCGQKTKIMNEAIRIGAENEKYSTENPTTEEQRIKHMDNLKLEINNLLHQFLPDDITLKEVEIIAMTFNDIIWKPKDFLSAVAKQNGA